jgi:hypothetical protein
MMFFIAICTKKGLFVFRSILKILFLINFLLITNVSANPHAKQTIDLGDEFISEFVKDKNSPKIDYDGKTLTLYAEASSFQYFIAIFCLAIMGSLEAKAIVGRKQCNDKALVFTALSILTVINLTGLMILCRNLHFDIKNVPMLKIDKDEIVYWDKQCIKWKKIDRVKMFRTFTSNGTYTTSCVTIQLCDKFLNPLFTICDDGWNLPISADNLIALLEHYLKKSKT